MKKLTPISAIMSTDLITLSVFDSLEDAEKLFKKHKIRHIPITTDNKIVGMLSYSDLLRISFADATNNEQQIDAFVYKMFTIEQVMAKNLTVVDPNTSIKEVAKLFAEKEFHALPVLQNNNLKGIVTTTDLNLYLLAQLN